MRHTATTLPLALLLSASLFLTACAGMGPAGPPPGTFADAPEWNPKDWTAPEPETPGAPAEPPAEPVIVEEPPPVPERPLPVPRLIPPKAPMCRAYGVPRPIGVVEYPKLQEISGVAVSRRNPGVMWVHNDSGDGPFLYALTTTGKYLGTIKLAGFWAKDWEDIAIGPCGKADCIYVGDFGDNKGRRDDVAVYRVKEPAVDPARPFGYVESLKYDKFPFEYPDGPQNAESLLVMPDETVAVLTKRFASAMVFVFPELAPDEKVTLVPIGSLPLRSIVTVATAADAHPSGTRILIRTYLTALEYDIDPGEPIEAVFDYSPRIVPAAPEEQGEAISYDVFGGGYIHVSEGIRPTIYRVPCAN